MLVLQKEASAPDRDCYKVRAPCMLGPFCKSPFPFLFLCNVVILPEEAHQNAGTMLLESSSHGTVSQRACLLYKSLSSCILSQQSKGVNVQQNSSMAGPEKHPLLPNSIDGYSEIHLCFPKNPNNTKGFVCTVT